MLQKTLELGAYNVAHHCLSSSELKSLNVIDIAPSSISNKISFETAIRNNSNIVKYHFPSQGGERAYHIEIRQPSK